MKCEFCGKDFPPPKRGLRRFCSRTCQTKSWNARNPEYRKIEHHVARSALCLNCGKEFSFQWPNARQSACSRECGMALYRNKNRERLTQKSLEWAKKNRQSRLEIQRKWNNSEKGIRSKRKWYDSHISEVVLKFLSQFSQDEAFRKVAIARGTSNRRLKASGREYKCEVCGATNRLHCHHKDWNPLNWQDMDNLQWLCVRCHKLVHSEGYNNLGQPITASNP